MGGGIRTTDAKLLVRASIATCGLLLAWSLGACSREARPPAAAITGPVAGRYTGGAVTREEVFQEASRLAPPLRARFETETGRRELALSLIDRRLLANEARKEGLADALDLRRQVRSLEERLLIEALLAKREKLAGVPTEAETQAWYDAHATELRQPESVRVQRLLAAVAPGADEGERKKAQGRARKWREDLQHGAPFAALVRGSDGPEKANGGDLGAVARGDRGDRQFDEAAFGLDKVGAVSGVVETKEGYAVLSLVERHAAKTPALAEVRGEVESRMLPARKRKVFDDLVRALREKSDVQVDIAALR